MAEKRVSISYTVDLEEVPQRVQLLLSELATTLNAVAEVSKTAANKSVSPGDDPIEGLREIFRLKVLIGKTEERAQDCFNILKGYLEMTTVAQAKEAAPPPPPPPPPAPVEPPAKKKTTKKTAKKTTKKKKTARKKKEEE